MISVHYTGVDSNIASNKIITRAVFEKLEVLAAQGEFNFTGDPKKFGLVERVLIVTPDGFEETVAERRTGN